MFLAKTIFVILLVCWFADGQTTSISQCPPCDCNTRVACKEDDIRDPCSCCRRCYKRVGEECGELNGECSDELLCLPNDPYSASYEGKCYEITPCLTFGCREVDDENCECFYNNVCPMERLPYYTKEECEDALKIKKCDDVICPPSTEEKTCGEGFYYEEGPSIFDHCCPVQARCVCNVSMCSEPPNCPTGTKLVTQSTANPNNGQCCNEYNCEKLPGCLYKGSEYSFNETWTDSCSTCVCKSVDVECTRMLCPKMECEMTHTPEGQCCPVCLEEPAAINTCITGTEMIYNEGDMWGSPDNICIQCVCHNGKSQCYDKSCEPIICNENQELYTPAGECCPTMCKDKEMSPATTILLPLPTNNHFTPISFELPTVKSGHGGDTVTETPVGGHPRHLLLLLNTPYEMMEGKWDQFSLELTKSLAKMNVTIEELSIKPETASSAINGTIMSITINDMGGSNIRRTESDIAVTVNKMAIEYSIIPSPSASNNDDDNEGFFSTNVMHLTATVIVLTLLAAVTVASFIGVVIILAVINRRLKTAKSIRGIPTARRP